MSYVLYNFYFQVKRLETLLGKCKETIKSNKEKNNQLLSEKEERAKEIEQLKVSHFLTFLNLKLVMWWDFTHPFVHSVACFSHRELSLFWLLKRCSSLQLLTYWQSIHSEVTEWWVKSHLAIKVMWKVLYLKVCVFQSHKTLCCNPLICLFCSLCNLGYISFMICGFSASVFKWLSCSASGCLLREGMTWPKYDSQ